MVGNPFVCNAYLADDRDFYVLSEDGDEVVAATDNVIAPMQGLFVQAGEFEEEVVFTTTAPAKGKALNINLNKVPEPFEGPTLSVESSVSKGATIATVDNARIRFGEGHNLEKVQLDPDHSKLYIPQGGKDYAVAFVGRDVACNISTMDVNFKAEENGTYTLSFSTEENTFAYLRLIDNLTGDVVDLLAAELVEGSASYTFTAKTTDNASRFRLVFSLR